MRALLLLLCLFLISPSTTWAREPIRMTGSLLLQSIIKGVEDAYEKKHSKIRIEFVPGDADAALAALVAKKIDLALFSRNLTSDEKNRFPKIKLQSITVARDAIMPVVSFEVFMSGVRTLSYEDLTKIYSGELNNWSQLGGLKQEIYVIDLNDESGTRDVFMQAIFEDDSPLTTGVKKICQTDEEVQREVAQSSGAVAYLSSAWTQKKVRGIGIRTRNGIIYPTPENILSLEYPLSRNLVLVTVDDPSGDLKRFLNFLMGPEGQRVIQEMKFVPAIRY